MVENTFRVNSFRVNKLKFNRVIDKFPLHPRHDTIEAFLKFLSDKKIWTKYFIRLHEKFGLKVSELIDWFFKETEPSEYLSILDGNEFESINNEWLNIIDKLNSK